MSERITPVGEGPDHARPLVTEPAVGVLEDAMRKTGSWKLQEDALKTHGTKLELQGGEIHELASSIKLYAKTQFVWFALFAAALAFFAWRSTEVITGLQLRMESHWVSFDARLDKIEGDVKK